MHEKFTITRRPPSAVPADGILKAGAGSRDITPALGTHLSGFGSMRSQAARKMWGRLYATALVLDDGRGERVALVAVDLHAGTRYLAELVAAEIAADTGIGIDRLFFAGTHTHSGPGHFYGNTLYDGMAAKERGLDRPAALAIAHGVAAAVRDAIRSMKGARIGHGVARRWNYSQNRSLRAFKNDGALPKRFAYNHADGMGVPEAVPEEELAVDPRVQVIWAEDLEGIPIGAFATFAAHGTAIAARHATLSSDWFGTAVREAQARIRKNDVYWRDGAIRLGRRPRVPIALAGGAMGDVDVGLPGQNTSAIIAQQGIELARKIGEAVGETLELACSRARENLQDELSIRVRFSEPEAAGAPLDDGRTLAPFPAFGVPVVGGSELGRNFMIDPDILELDVSFESKRTPFDGVDPHSPKVTISHELVEAFTGRAAPILPLRLVMLESPTEKWWIPGLPGEPTTMEAYRIERTLRDLGATVVIVTGVCGDYAGYFTTPKEYERQHYEGASTLWGRATGDWLIDQMRRLATGIVVPLADEASFEMDAVYSPPEDPPCSDVPSGLFPLRPEIAMEGDTVVGRWRASVSQNPSFGPSAWILFEERRGDVWEPLIIDEEPVTDHSYPMEIERYIESDQAFWVFRFKPPQELGGRTIRFALMPSEFDLPSELAVSSSIYVRIY